MALNAESKRDLVAEARHRALHTTSRVESAGLDELADALDASQKKLTRVDERLAELIRFHDHAATYEQGAYQVMHETFANELRRLAELSEQAACECPKGQFHRPGCRNAPPAPPATTGDFNNRLLRLEGIVKAIIEAVRGDHQ